MADGATIYCGLQNKMVTEGIVVDNLRKTVARYLQAFLKGPS